MPTILYVMGWRFFFYSNERNEPIHIHGRKADKECKYWLDRKHFDIRQAFCFNMNDKDKRQVKKIIFDYFEFIEEQWAEFLKERER
jgi:hypothetical protein